MALYKFHILFFLRAHYTGSKWSIAITLLLHRSSRAIQWRHSLLTRLALRQGPPASRGPEQL